MSKLSAAAFAVFLMERATKKDGYIMGSRGQNPKDWAKKSWWFEQYSGKQKTQALYWREKSERVWDCQGLAEGYINDMTGNNIDVRARNNYASWCDPAGKGTIPEQYRVPGAAVFKAYNSGVIHHVGYLVKPVKADKPTGDWYVVEARGVMYGVVITQLLNGGWNRWGIMSRYFDYSTVETPVIEFGDRALKNGCMGDDVRQLQGMLIERGYSCGKWGTDGDFGDYTEKAVMAFQNEYRLPVDGIVDDDDYTVLRDVTLPDDPDEPEASYLVDALDLSSHNAAREPDIDWQKVKDTCGFLVLRAGCTRVKTQPLGIGADVFFPKWAHICRTMGIPIWAYYYSHAKTVEAARVEARFLYQAASQYDPVGYCMDSEEKCLTREIIEAFYAELDRLGVKRTMLYIAHHYIDHYDLPTDDDGFISVADAIWPPRYGQNDGSAKQKYLPKIPCDLWQYTSRYCLDGIPDSTLDANRVTGQRHTMAWFRGEE